MTMCETCMEKEECKDFSDLEFDVRLCEDYEPEELKHVGGGWYAYKKEDGTYSEPFIWKGRNNNGRQLH